MPKLNRRSTHLEQVVDAPVMDFRTWWPMIYWNLKGFELSTWVKRLIPIVTTNGLRIAILDVASDA
jgi:hypothetical protein